MFPDRIPQKVKGSAPKHGILRFRRHTAKRHPKALPVCRRGRPPRWHPWRTCCLVSRWSGGSRSASAPLRCPPRHRPPVAPVAPGNGPVEEALGMTRKCGIRNGAVLGRSQMSPPVLQQVGSAPKIPGAASRTLWEQF
jgi:hypothetical protein